MPSSTSPGEGNSSQPPQPMIGFTVLSAHWMSVISAIGRGFCWESPYPISPRPVNRCGIAKRRRSSEPNRHNRISPAFDTSRRHRCHCRAFPSPRAVARHSTGRIAVGAGHGAIATGGLDHFQRKSLDPSPNPSSKKSKIFGACPYVCPTPGGKNGGAEMLKR
jgi:hypothetical protein